jgi:catechol 2,3-dioxygenase-like lactoylglutathione lyase family enzyme
MELAKQFIDVGLQTNQREDMLDFWQRAVALPFEEMLPLGGGRQQHRHGMNGSVLKINHARDPLPDEGPSGYRELIIARDGLVAEQHLEDPDGNLVTLVPKGAYGVDHIGIRLRVADMQACHHFYQNILQIERLDDTTYRWATTLLFLEEDPGHKPVAGMGGKGYRYLTVQVWNVDEEHGAFLSRGGSEGRSPVTLGKVARISFILDSDRNWIEVSQRASLTGELSG